MKFERAEPVCGQGYLELSEGQKWELAIVPALGGRWQVTVGDGKLSIEVRYCCGENPVLAQIVFGLVRKILEPRDEARLTYEDLQQIFPKWTRRPVDLCPVVIPRLIELAEKAEVGRQGAEARA